MVTTNKGFTMKIYTVYGKLPADRKPKSNKLIRASHKSGKVVSLKSRAIKRLYTIEGELK